MIPCVEGRTDRAPVVAQASRWGSIIPAAWSFMLAARARGLGSVWTTFHLRHEHEAAEILGIPFETVMQAALIPVAYSVGTDFKPYATLWTRWFTGIGGRPAARPRRRGPVPGRGGPERRERPRPDGTEPAGTRWVHVEAAGRGLHGHKRSPRELRNVSRVPLPTRRNTRPSCSASKQPRVSRSVDP